MQTAWDEARRIFYRPYTSAEEEMGWLYHSWKEHEEMPKKVVPELMNRHEPEVIPVRSDPKIGRNDPCPCGSGRKFKKCCIKRIDAQRHTPLSVFNRPIPLEHQKLNTLMERGYQFFEDDKMVLATESWKPFWAEIKGRLKPEHRSTEDEALCNVFEGFESSIEKSKRL